MLEAKGSWFVMLLFVAALLGESTKASVSVLSMLSVSSSNRIAAITESNFKDWQATEKKKKKINRKPMELKILRFNT